MFAFASKRLVAILFVLLWLELSLPPIFSAQPVKPNFFFIFLAFYAFRINWKNTVFLAFLIGLIQDLVTGAFFGLETASYVGGAVLLQFFSVRFDREKPWIQLVSLFFFSWFVLILFSLLSVLVQHAYRLNEWILMNAFFVSLYTIAVGFFVFPLLEKWLKPVLRERQYELF